MKTLNINYWIWGLLDQKNENLISQIRKEIASEIETPLFPIHLTLSGPINLELSKISKNLDIFLNHKKYNDSLSLQYYGLDWINSKYRYLYLLVNNPDLIVFKKSIDDVFKINSNNFLPHISLAYSDNFNFERSKFIDLLARYEIKDLFIDKICIAEVDEKKNIWRIVKIFNIF